MTRHLIHRVWFFLVIAAAAGGQVAPARLAEGERRIHESGAVTTDSNFERTEPPAIDLHPAPAPIESADEETPPPLDSLLQGVHKELDAMSDSRDRESGDASARAGGADPMKSPLGKVVVSLCLVVAAILISGYFLRKVGRRTPLLAGTDLATPIGKVHLAPRVCLHFVRTADKVLVVGVTQNCISLLTEFEAEVFDARTGSEAEEQAAGGPRDEGFRDALAAFSEDSGESAGHQGTSDPGDVDLALLRKEIERLRQSIQGTSRDPVGS